VKVDLIAHTTVSNDFLEVVNELGFECDVWSRDAEDLIEFAGRSCYESYHKPNAKTRSNQDYLANVAKQKHFSVYEHASVTFFLRGLSRALTHEFVRHRHFSYSQVSQRYVNSSERPFVEHSVLERATDNSKYMIADHMEASIQLYEQLVEDLVAAGYSRKEARGAARLVLPEGTTTDLVVTGNFRAWIEFINKRNTDHADAEIHELAAEIKRQLQNNFPFAFQEEVFEVEEREQPVSIQKPPQFVVTDEELSDPPVNLQAYIRDEIKKALDASF
jgi:thymidylate synthase (FAD)